MARRITRSNKFLMISLAAMILVVGPAWGQRQDPTNLGFTKRFTVEVTNSGPVPLDNWPIVLNVEEIRQSIPDFNISRYALFEETAREFILAVSQADDLDRDRIIDEIVFVRTIPAATTLTFTCYYSPRGSFQLMTTPKKADARFGWDTAKSALGWESNFCGYLALDGQVEFFAKFDPFLVLKFFKAGMSPKQDWGMFVFAAGETSGLGGLNLWEGSTRIPMAQTGTSASDIEKTMIASGPLRSVVRIGFKGVRGVENEYEVDLTLSAFADNIFSRQDVTVKGASPSGVVCAPGVRKIPGESWTIDAEKGYASAWGKGVRGAGEIGLAIIFPPEDFAGLEESESERFIKLRPGDEGRCTYWIAGGWDKGIRSPLPPRGMNWVRQTEALAGKLLAPLVVRIKKP